MEIEKFIEQDIRHYLEQRQSSGDEVNIEKTPRKNGILAPDEIALYTLSRDYASELEAALKERDTPKAKRVLQALKESMNEYPPDSPEHVEAKRLFTSLYATFKRTISQHEEFEEELLRQEVASLGPPPTAQPTPERVPSSLPSSSAVTQPPSTGPPPTAQPTPERVPSSLPSSSAVTQPPSTGPPPTAQPTPERVPSSLPSSSAVTQPPSTPSVEMPVKRSEQSQGMSQKEEEAFLADIAETESLLQEHSYRAAIRHYQDIKRRLSLEQMSPAQRARVHERLKSIYETIHRLIIGKHGKREKQESMQEPGLLKRFKRHLSVAKEATDAGELTEAMQQYQILFELRKGLLGATRQEAMQSLTELHERILSLRQQLKEKKLDEAEQRLHAKP